MFGEVSAGRAVWGTERVQRVRIRQLHAQRDVRKCWPRRVRRNLGWQELYGRSERRGVDFCGTVRGKQRWWSGEEGGKKLLRRQKIRGKVFKNPQIGKLGSEEEGREGEWQEGWGPESRGSEGWSEEILPVRRGLQVARTQWRR